MNIQTILLKSLDRSDLLLVIHSFRVQWIRELLTKLMGYTAYSMCENPQVWEFMRRFWELFTMFRFLHDIYQFIGIIIYSIALLINEQFDIGRRNKKNVLLWKKKFDESLQGRNKYFIFAIVILNTIFLP